MRVVEEVDLVDDAVEAHAEARERGVVAAQRPFAHAQPERLDLRVAGAEALQQPLGEVVVGAVLARERRVALGPASDLGGRQVLHVAAVAGTDEVVALEPGALRRLPVEELQVAGHRLAHLAADVADLRLVHDVGAAGRGERAERVPERDGAQVADVQRLRRVRVAVVDDEALVRRDVAAEERLDRDRLQRRAERGDALVGEPQQHAVAGRVESGVAHGRVGGQQRAHLLPGGVDPAAAAAGEEDVAAGQRVRHDQRGGHVRAAAGRERPVQLVEHVRHCLVGAHRHPQSCARRSGDPPRRVAASIAAPRRGARGLLAG